MKSKYASGRRGIGTIADQILQSYSKSLSPLACCWDHTQATKAHEPDVLPENNFL